MKIRLSDFMGALNSLPKRPHPWPSYSVFIPHPRFYAESEAMDPTDPTGITLHLRWDGEAWQIQNPTQITLIP